MKKIFLILFGLVVSLAVLSSCTTEKPTVTEPQICSSYLLAVENGYEGTEEEWIADIMLEVDALLKESGKAADAEACGKLFEELFLFVETCFDVEDGENGTTYALKESMTPELITQKVENLQTTINQMYQTSDKLEEGMNTIREELASMNVDAILSAVESVKALDTDNLNIMMSSTLGVPTASKEVETLTDGRTIVLEELNTVMNNKHLTFTCDLSALSGNGVIRLGHGKTSYSSAYIEITSTELRVCFYYSEAREPKVYKHGLTISHYLNVNIDVGYGYADIKLTCPTGVFEKKNVGWDGGRNGEIFCEVDNLTVFNTKLTWFSDDYKKNIWMFGDSYFSTLYTSRWPYYLVQDGYTNHLMAGYPGMGTETALKEFKSALKYGTPQYAVWCMGMNDPDGNWSNGQATSANSKWLAATEEFIAICEQKGITPILATIPTTVARDNTQKNIWVRNSGYRYVDFEHAVVMNKKTWEWFPNMLNADNTHPLDLGAQALYSQFLVDFPEIMCD